MTAALGAGGRVVGYLADSLVRRVREPNTRRAVADGTILLGDAVRTVGLVLGGQRARPEQADLRERGA